MLRVACLLVFSAAAFTSGCATYPRNCATIYSPAGQELLGIRSSTGWLCCLHHVPLVTVRGFSPSFGLIVDPSETECKASLKWPNFLKAGWELKRSKDISTPVTLMYCPKCQEELERVQQHERIFGSENASNRAMQRTAGRFAFLLPTTSTAHQQRCALSPAVADLVSR